MARKPKPTDVPAVDQYMKGSSLGRLRTAHELVHGDDAENISPADGPIGRVYSRADARAEQFLLGITQVPQLNALTQEQRDYNAISAALAEYRVDPEGPAAYVPLRVFTNEQGVVGLNPAATLERLDDIVLQSQVEGTLPPVLAAYASAGQSLSMNDVLRESLEAEAADADNARLLQGIAEKHPASFAEGAAFIYQLPPRASPSP